MFLKYRSSCFQGTHVSGYFREWREVNLIQSVSGKSCSEISDNSKVRGYSEIFFTEAIC